ncbi:HTH-type transcriptional repressor YtrA [Clostridium acetireducens DSM 10703]|jgi:GntR family transcriptional regulator|uniref:HTH-type transcriptional repressor YtrA n=1 Tax=Clostridium acetireducens DSM 10703 TaxID=1121290 RepID=A0A1E8F0W4_9CLOT|nr:GntR family transcriptional regulator [Clostridium acetireducens]OFI06972.1 HTH-type transcriptional repressor YtrA [Clostridium acetireducens DSM 10703]
MKIKFSEKYPIYIQIINIIKKDIVLGKLKEGDKLSSVREFSGKLKVNPNTVQRAYQELEREGITYTQRGMGTFVKEDNEMVSQLKFEMSKEVITTFINEMKDLGFKKEEIKDILLKVLEKEEV